MAKIMIVGGIPESLTNFRGDLIKQWTRLGHQVVAVSALAEGSVLSSISDIGAKFKPIPIKRAGLNPLDDFKTIAALKRIIGEERPAMVFAYTIKPVIYTAFALRLTRVEARYYPMVTGLGYAFVGQGFKGRLLNRVSVILYRLALKRSSLVFFQNKDDLKLFKDLKIMPEGQQAVTTNGSGVNIEHFAYSPVTKEKRISFLLVGRLLLSKGLSEYAEAARIIKAKHPKVAFKLLGPLDPSPDGITKTELEKWQNDGLITYYPYDSDVRPYLKECSVYVLPSYREGTPRSVLEAMATGRAVITTDAPGCRETVMEGVNGFLVPVKDSKALARAMVRFIDEPALIEKMGEASRCLAEEKYDVHKANDAISKAMGLI